MALTKERHQATATSMLRASAWRHMHFTASKDLIREGAALPASLCFNVLQDDCNHRLLLWEEREHSASNAVTAHPREPPTRNADPLGASDLERCVQLNTAAHLEEHLCLCPSAKRFFAEPDDDAAPERLKQNRRNNMDRHVFKNKEFVDMTLESDQHEGLGTQSFQKGAANEA